MVVLDKGRRVGGRTSRRRVDEVVVTHGAPRLDTWPDWMTAWADAEIGAERLTTLDEGFALVDGPEVITSWLMASMW